ncbi:MAG: aminobenzoyl-glutamate utilization protein B, partial [Roseivirga sp.]
WDYFNNVQSKETKYVPMITADDAPPIYLNKKIMDQFRPQLENFYYDETKYATYLEQLGVTYPTVKKGN